MRKTVFSFIILWGLQLPAGRSKSTAGSDNGFLPRVNTVYYKLGERSVQVNTYQYGDIKDLVYINLHDDEITAVNGARKVLEKKGGFLIKIENYRTRNLKFKLDGKQYTIDPNRMFSREGIARSLLIFGNTSQQAIDEVERFANRILQLIPRNASWIIALHNNTNGKYSVNSYKQGGDKEKDAMDVNVNDDLDADDFFFTTDSILFARLSADNFNTILQDNLRAKRDGSLSIYCGERNMRYVNCETEHGRQPEYDQMIAVAAAKVIGNDSRTISSVNNAAAKKPMAVPTDNKTGTTVPGKKNPNAIAYSYRIAPVTTSFSLKTNTEILFGEKQVGWVRSVLRDSSKSVMGKFEMDKSFALYSNMDFFLFISSSASPRLEVRIDPTRKKELVNPQSATIAINTRIIN